MTGGWADARPRGQQAPGPTGRHASSASQLYWQLIDARRAPTTAGRRRKLLELIHRIAGATVTSLYCGNSSPKLVDQVGEVVVDVKHDDRARAALTTRRTVTLDADDRYEVEPGMVFTGGLWRPLDAQGIKVGLVRLLARAPQALHPGTVTLVGFTAAWLASSVVTDRRPSVWVDPTLEPTADGEFDEDLDDIADLIVEAGRVRSPDAVDVGRRPIDGSGTAGRLTLAV